MAAKGEDDCFLAKEGFGKWGLAEALSCVLTGKKLMGYLTDRFRPEPKRLPNLILLDLNMPQKDDRQPLNKMLR
jgi:hypothetical protein